MFRVLFTSLVFIVSLASAAALVYAIYRIATDGADMGAVIAGVSGAVGSGAAVFVGKRAQEAVKVARSALNDVGKYCGAPLKSELEGA